MATYKILYWQEIPSQIKVDDGSEEINLELPQKFMDRIDRAAQERGLDGSDDYLAQWHWSEEEDRDGSAKEVADALKAELEAKTNW
jgi:hypothetical protein